MNKREMVVLVFPEVNLNDIEDPMFGVQPGSAAYELLRLMLDNNYSTTVTTPTGGAGVAFYERHPGQSIQGVEAWVTEFVELSRNFPDVQLFVIDDQRKVLKITMDGIDAIMERLGTLEFVGRGLTNTGDILFKAGHYSWKVVKND